MWRVRFVIRISKYGGDMIERRKINKNNNEVIDELSVWDYD